MPSHRSVSCGISHRKGHFVVKANDTQDEQSKLRDDEIIAQVRTLMLAGHETVAKTVSKSDALSHCKTSHGPRSVAHIRTLGAREEAQHPVHATEGGYRGI